MRFSIHPKVLADVSQKCNSVALKRGKPILAKMFVQARDGFVTFQATDLEMAVSITVPATVEENGSTVIDPKPIFAATKASKNIVVTIATDGEVAQLLSEHCTAQLEVDNPNDFPFPSVKDWSRDTYHSINACDLVRILERSSFACAGGEARWGATTGVLCELNGSARVVGTDGRRMSICEAPSESHNGHEVPGAVVPAKCADLLCRLLAKSAGKVNIRVNHAALPADAGKPVKGAALEVLFTHDTKDRHISVYTRTVDGRFPPYEQVIPKTAKLSASFTVGDLLPILKQANGFGDDECRGVNFSFSPTRLTLSMKGKCELSCPATLHDNPDHTTFNISFDGRFIAEALNCFGKKDRLTFDFSDNNQRPAVIRNAGSEFRYVVVPLATK